MKRLGHGNGPWLLFVFLAICMESEWVAVLSAVFDDSSQGEHSEHASQLAHADVGALVFAGLVADHLAADVLALGMQYLPNRVGRMSRQQAARHARRALANKRKVERKAGQKCKFAKLADAWDLLHGLRNGSKVCRDGETGKQHRNAWSLQGMLRLGLATLVPTAWAIQLGAQTVSTKPHILWTHWWLHVHLLMQQKRVL